MTSSREQLKQAIQAQENLRGSVDDSIIEIAISTLRQQLATLESSEKEQQRKLVTLIFVDVVESTKLVRDLDPEDNLEIMDTALQRLAAPITAYGGRATRFMGDGFKAVFGLPKSHENDPEMTLRAGLAVLEAARIFAQKLKAEQGIASFQVRVGINTGLVATGGQSGGQSRMPGTLEYAAKHFF